MDGKNDGATEPTILMNDDKNGDGDFDDVSTMGL